MNVPVLSFTFLNNFENCPRKAYHMYVVKDLPRMSTTPEQQWGQDVHKAFELRLKTKKPLPDNMTRYEPFAQVVDAAPAIKLIEENLAITSDGSKTEFFGANVWLRGKADVAILDGNNVMVLDWKTGKPREDTFELELFGLMLKCTYPGISNARGAYVWLKENRVGPTHDLSNFARTFNDVKLRARDIEALPLDRDWPATPNPLCPWCPHFKCEHNSNPKRNEAHG